MSMKESFEEYISVRANGLKFNTDIYEIPPKTRLEISNRLRREMLEIFSGTNVF